jgi:hypothetical protein
VQARSSTSLKVVTAYRPCASNGAMSGIIIYINHMYDNDDRCPRQAFLDDLQAGCNNGFRRRTNRCSMQTETCETARYSGCLRRRVCMKLFLRNADLQLLLLPLLSEYTN